MMSSNPEFDRNLWLELTPHRMVTLPVVFGLLLLLHLVLNDFRLQVVTAYSALTLFGLFTGIWGTKCAAGSVYDEVVGRTWDWQRMSGLDPWSMTWGKLFGGTAFAWYGGLFCLAIAILSLVVGGAERNDWVWLGVALFAVLFTHALALFLNLLYIRSRPLERARSGGSLYLFVLLLMLVSSWSLAPSSNSTLVWYGYTLPLSGFILGSVVLGWFWALTAAYRVMRREFLHTARPWVWTTFLAFVAFHVGGLVAHTTAQWVFCAFLLWWAATLLALFVEQKDPVTLRGLFTALQQGDLDRASQRVPSWLTALFLATLAAISLLGFTSEHLAWEKFGDIRVASLALCLLLFMLRDVAIFLLLAFGSTAKRPEVSGIIFLIVLYLVIPSLLKPLELDLLSAVFIPRPDLPLPFALGGPLLGLVVVGVLLIRQWGRLGFGRGSGRE